MRAFHASCVPRVRADRLLVGHNRASPCPVQAAGERDQRPWPALLCRSCVCSTPPPHDRGARPSMFRCSWVTARRILGVYESSAAAAATTVLSRSTEALPKSVEGSRWPHSARGDEALVSSPRAASSGPRSSGSWGYAVGVASRPVRNDNGLRAVLPGAGRAAAAHTGHPASGQTLPAHDRRGRA